MTRKEIIDYLKGKGIEFNPTLKLKDLEELYQKHSTEIPTEPKTETQIEPSIPSPMMSDMEKLLGMVGTMVNQVEKIDSRLKKVEGPTGNEFKNNIQQADVDSATEKKISIDPRVVKIVEEVLGIDFGIDMETFPDRPGFLFTVIVPNRLSDMPPSTRPVVDPLTGKYKVQEDGKTPILEDYIPQDRRSRAIGSSQSYDAIRDHCNKVRAYLVSYYTKMSKPLPEFKLKG